MKKILALFLIASLLIGGAGATKRPLYGDEGALSTDVTTDSTGIGVIIAAANGLQADVDALELSGGNSSALTTSATNYTDAINEVNAEADVNAVSISYLETNLSANDTRLSVVETNLAANDTRLVVVEAYPYWHIQTITTPIVANATRCLDDEAITTVGVNVTTFTAQPDVPRGIGIDPADAITASFLLTGTNINDEVITAYINFSASNALTLTGTAFKTLTSITGTTDANTTIDVGVSDVLGLDTLITDTGQVIAASLGGTREATFPTLAKGATVELCTADISGTLDGAKDVKIYMVIP